MAKGRGTGRGRGKEEVTVKDKVEAMDTIRTAAPQRTLPRATTRIRVRSILFRVGAKRSQVLRAREPMQST